MQANWLRAARRQRRGWLWLAVGHRALDLYGAAHRVHHTGKFRQEAVAGVLYDPAPVLSDLRIDQFPEVGLEPFVFQMDSSVS